jgi:DNA-binding CsgD family transcriptional regulator
MDVLLETCFMHFHGCGYQITFNDYVLGKAELSLGKCPQCPPDHPRPTVIYCPGCQRPTLTEAYLANKSVCDTCHVPLSKECEQRRIWLSDLAIVDKVRQSTMPLQPLEKRILKMMVEGLSNKEMADALGIKLRTVETFRARIMQKLNAHSMVELVHYAIVYSVVTLNEIFSKFFTKRGF